MADIFREIDLALIQPSKFNPRLSINPQRLAELADSIKAVGLLEPVIVRPLKEGFELVIGERRYRACQKAGLKHITAIVRQYTDDEVAQLNLIENVQREELNAIEKGKVCRYLLDNCSEKYSTESALASRIGVTPSTISAWLRSTQVIPEEAQEYVAPSDQSGNVPAGKIDYSTAIKIGRSMPEARKRVEIIRSLAERKLPATQRAAVIQRIISDPGKSIEKAVEEVASMPFTLEFYVEDKEPLLKGIKTQTSRPKLPNERLKTGAHALASISEPHFLDLKITVVERKRLRYFSEDDAQREGGYTLKEFKRLWQGRYGQWDEDQLVYIIHFEKTGTKKPI